MIKVIHTNQLLNDSDVNKYLEKGQRGRERCHAASAKMSDVFIIDVIDLKLIQLGRYEIKWIQ